MVTERQWIRVSKREPCKICLHVDWCTASADGLIACCMRVESEKLLHNGGYLHRLADTPLPTRRYVPKPEPEVTINPVALLRHWAAATTADMVGRMAGSLGVTATSLHLLGCVWAGQHSAWAFPMHDGGAQVVGIRLRDDHGNKWAVKGSKQGIFLPVDSEIEPQATCYVCEGPTDTSAALSLGLYAIGRPSCLGCEDAIVKLLRLRRVNKVVIVADNDEHGAGLRGAEKLQAVLPLASCIWLPPAKDLRELVRNGGDAELIRASVQNLQWTKAPIHRPEPAR